MNCNGRCDYNNFPEYKSGGLAIVYARLKDGTLHVDFSTGKIYSVNSTWNELTVEYDDHAGNQRYAFVTIRRKCISYRKGFRGQSSKIITWRRRKIAVHKLVWIAKHGLIPRGYDVHHKDLNSLNNRLSNLELLEKHIHLQLHTDLEAVPL